MDNPFSFSPPEKGHFVGCEQHLVDWRNRLTPGIEKWNTSKSWLVLAPGGMGKTSLLKRMQEIADDEWWHETFIQLAGLTEDPNALARALADVNPWLALWCVEEGRQVDDATREIIRKRSEARVRSPRVQDRRRAAEALVQLQTPRVIEPLATLSLDTDATTARTALQALLK
ncbi:MAG: hypothetical protein GYB65_11265, partial [Chloroflexi bacterium]|nr:hypothetical protein [Chloroflexota bacterium]